MTKGIIKFGAYIRKKREEQGIAMSDFARQIGISPAYWSRIERDMEKPPKDELIKKAANILGLCKDEAFIASKRVPPDLRDNIREMVKLYRSSKN